MSIKAMRWARGLRGLLASEKAVLLCIASYADNQRFECYPGIELIAENTGLSRRTVSRAVGVLSRVKLVRVEVNYRRGKPAGGRYQNRYTLTLSDTELMCHQRQTWVPPATDLGATVSSKLSVTHYSIKQSDEQSEEQPQKVGRRESGKTGGGGTMSSVDEIHQSSLQFRSDEELLGDVRFTAEGLPRPASLMTLLRDLTVKYHPGPALPAATLPQVGQLAQFVRLVGRASVPALYWAAREWGALVAVAERDYGIRGLPGRPTAGALLRAVGAVAKFAADREAARRARAVVAAVPLQLVQPQVQLTVRRHPRDPNDDPDSPRVTREDLLGL